MKQGCLHPRGNSAENGMQIWSVCTDTATHQSTSPCSGGIWEWHQGEERGESKQLPPLIWRGLIWVDCVTSLEKITEKEKELHICNLEAWNQDKDSPHLIGCNCVKQMTLLIPHFLTNKWDNTTSITVLVFYTSNWKTVITPLGRELGSRIV